MTYTGLIGDKEDAWSSLATRLTRKKPRWRIIGERYSQYLAIEAMKATGRFFRYPPGDFFQATMNLMQEPISHICVKNVDDKEWVPEPDDIVLLLEESEDSGSIETAIRSGIVNRERSSYMFSGRNRTYEIETPDYSERYVDKDGIISLKPNQSPGEKIRIGDRVRIRHGKVVVYHPPEPDEGELDFLDDYSRRRTIRRDMQSTYELGLNLDKEYVVLGISKKGEYLLAAGPFITPVPKGNVTKAEAGPENDNRTDLEIRAILKTAVYGFYLRKGIFNSYELIAQMLRVEKELNQNGKTRSLFKDHGLEDFDFIIRGFEVVYNVGRLCR